MSYQKKTPPLINEDTSTGCLVRVEETKLLGRSQEVKSKCLLTEFDVSIFSGICKSIKSKSYKYERELDTHTWKPLADSSCKSTKLKRKLSDEKDICNEEQDSCKDIIVPKKLDIRNKWIKFTKYETPWSGLECSYSNELPITRKRCCLLESMFGTEVSILGQQDHMMWNVRSLDDHEPVKVSYGGGKHTTVMWKIYDRYVFAFKTPGSKLYYVSAYHAGPGELFIRTNETHPLSVSHNNMATDLRFFRYEYDRKINGYVLKPEFNTDLFVIAKQRIVTLAQVSNTEDPRWILQL
uniref:uncharacterized protein LOC120348480 n=1 Tax=Styela clava TaxID=7725 RepID=UPI0019398890|nr:uncharacterized protein LOC120348480 [Styela clava]